jgi:hypothetical protein
VTNGGSGAASYSFISGISSEVTFRNSTVGPLSLGGSSASFISAGDGLRVTVSQVIITLLSSSSGSALIFSDNITDQTQGITTISVEYSSFYDMVV